MLSQIKLVSIFVKYWKKSELANRLNKHFYSFRNVQEFLEGEVWRQRGLCTSLFWWWEGSLTLMWENGSQIFTHPKFILSSDPVLGIVHMNIKQAWEIDNITKWRHVCWFQKIRYKVRHWETMVQQYLMFGMTKWAWIWRDKGKLEKRKGERAKLKSYKRIHIIRLEYILVAWIIIFNFCYTWSPLLCIGTVQ